MSDFPPLKLYVPEPTGRPGRETDFSYLNLSPAGAVRRPPIDIRPLETRDVADALIRVLDDDGRAVGPWDPKADTQLLLVVLGGLWVLETSSVIAQVVAFRVFDRRLFRMAPIHHHFELVGWPEFTVIVRFWIVSGLSVAFGLGLFYADFLARGGVQ